MKKISLIILLLTGFFGPARACDVCGCGNGGAFFGLLPQSHSNLLGVRYRTKSFDSHLLSPFFRAQEQFHTTELYTRFYPLNKVQVMAFLPVHANVQTRQLDQSQQRIQGLGDATVLVHYAAVNTLFDSSAHTWDHILLLGGGVKAPTGKYQYDESRGEVANANFQLGTGSWDFPISINYTLRKGQTGLNVDFSHRFTTFNSQAYRFANRQMVALTLFQQRYFGKASWMPNVGFTAEHAGQDVKAEIRNTYTGANLVQAMGGSELYVGRWAVGATAYLPVYQKLSGGELRIRPNVQAHITLNF